MADSTDRAPAAADHGTEQGPVAALQRAASDAAAATLQQAYRGFIDHIRGCTDCRATGLDCQLAADLKQIWRDAKGPGEAP